MSLKLKFRYRSFHISFDIVTQLSLRVADLAADEIFSETLSLASYSYTCVGKVFMLGRGTAE